MTWLGSKETLEHNPRVLPPLPGLPELHPSWPASDSGEASGRLIKITESTMQPPRGEGQGESTAQLKFTYGEKQKVDSIQLDNLFTDLQEVLKKHPLIPAANIDTLISEWINDLLFLAGKITEEELQEAMKAFETKGAEVAPEKEAAAEAEDDDSDDDDDDE